MRLACARSLRKHTQHAATEPLYWHLWSLRQRQRRCIYGRAPATMATSASANGHDQAEYRTLAAPHSSLLVVKASKFLTTSWPISSREEALAHVEAASEPGASHNCWAYRVAGDARSADDGEPGGTAGRPILAAIDGEGLDRVCVLVTRHFGGTKLGTGGLARAYSGAARQCLQEAPRRTVMPTALVMLEVSFQDIGAVCQLLDQHCAERLSEDYGDGANAGVVLRVRVDASQVDSLQTAATNASSGRVTSTMLT